MTNNGNGVSQEQMVPQQEQRDITKEDIHAQQRAHLAMRSLDMEAENVLLQQENAKLKARIAELEAPPVRQRNHHPIPAQSDA